MGKFISITQLHTSSQKDSTKFTIIFVYCRKKCGTTIRNYRILTALVGLEKYEATAHRNSTKQIPDIWNKKFKEFSPGEREVFCFTLLFQVTIVCCRRV